MKEFESLVSGPEIPDLWLIEDRNAFVAALKEMPYFFVVAYHDNQGTKLHEWQRALLQRELSNRHLAEFRKVGMIF